MPSRATIVAVLLPRRCSPGRSSRTSVSCFHIAINVCLAAIAAASLHLIIRTGHVSLCHAAFIGIGAYTSAYVVMQLGLPFIAGLALGTFAAALLALLIGPVILRLTGKYFVLITFLFGEIVRMVFVDWQAVTGGANGIYRYSRSGTDLRRAAQLLLAGAARRGRCASASAAGCCNRSSDGTIDSIREDEQLAECSGVPVIRIKVMIFVIACALAGFVGVAAGALHALHQSAGLQPDRVAELRHHERDRRHAHAGRAAHRRTVSGAHAGIPARLCAAPADHLRD